MSDDWFKELAKRCPWFRNNHLCAGNTVWNTHLERTEMKKCTKESCAPFFMAATIISVYKEEKE